MSRATKPELPPQKHREPPRYAGDMQKVCSYCQHFTAAKAVRNGGDCHNGISGRLTTRAIDGCAFGFYPSVERFPLRAGPGGTR